MEGSSETAENKLELHQKHFNKMLESKIQVEDNTNDYDCDNIEKSEAMAYCETEYIPENQTHEIKLVLVVLSFIFLCEKKGRPHTSNILITKAQR